MPLDGVAHCVPVYIWYINVTIRNSVEMAPSWMPGQARNDDFFMMLKKERICQILFP